MSAEKTEEIFATLERNLQTVGAELVDKVKVRAIETRPCVHVMSCSIQVVLCAALRVLTEFGLRDTSKLARHEV